MPLLRHRIVDQNISTLRKVEDKQLDTIASSLRTLEVMDAAMTLRDTPVLNN
jgi:hypothetical protein